MQSHDAGQCESGPGPHPFGNLPTLICVAAGTLWVAMFVPSVLVMEAAMRWPGLTPPEWTADALAVGAFLLSGIVTMRCSARWLGPAHGFVVLLKRVTLVASACLLLAFVTPLCLDSLLEEGWPRPAEWLSALPVFCVLWLCWVASGLAVSLRRGPDL